MQQIIWVDVMSDSTEELMGSYRQNTVAPRFKGNIQRNFVKSEATQTKLKNALKNQKKGIVSCSAHGEYNRLNSYRGRHLFNTNENFGEIEGKIIHLKACLTAKKLGPELVKNGAKAFYGYNELLGFPSKNNYPDLIKFFMEPDEILIIELHKGLAAKYVHEAVMDSYNRNIQELKKKNAPQNYIGIMITNRDAFCSPEKSDIYGDNSSQLDIST